MIFENYLGNKTAWKILRFMFEVPGRKYSRKEIKRYTKAGNFALSNSLNNLVIYNILIKEKKGKEDIYYLNFSNPFVILLKELFKEEKKLFRGMDASKIIFIAKTVEKIVGLFNPLEVYLFGSQVKGIATKESDYDFAVIVERKSKEVVKIVSKFPENIQIHLFDKREFEDKKDKLVNEIIKQGIKLV